MVMGDDDGYCFLASLAIALAGMRAKDPATSHSGSNIVHGSLTDEGQR